MAPQDQPFSKSRLPLGRRHLPWLLALGTFGCADAGPGGGNSASGGSVADGGDSGSAAMGVDDGATGWQESDTDGPAESSSEGAEPAGDSSEGETSGVGEASTGTDEGSSDGGADGNPPADLWSLCSTDTDCLSGACVVLSVGGEIHGGYCSAPNCSNAVVDCSPPAAGNATPICLDIMDQVMNAHSVCALDCSGGATCPLGLVCMPEVGSICIAPPV